jgi:hypothetical protein
MKISDQPGLNAPQLASTLAISSKSSVEDILVDIMEPKPLPIGMSEFESWANRIIAGALIVGEPGMEERLIDSQKFTLASTILTLGPTESHKPDAYFIHVLRKAAANQIAHAAQQTLHKKAKEQLAKEESVKAIGSGGVLSLVKESNSEVLDKS